MNQMPVLGVADCVLSPGKALAGGIGSVTYLIRKRKRRRDNHTPGPGLGR